MRMRFFTFLFISILSSLGNLKGAMYDNTSMTEPFHAGVVSLRPDIPFSKQVVKPNTIYLIYDTFDLDNKEVELPSHCSFEFLGGRLRNGTIVADEFEIKPTKRKIFDRIKFKGSCAQNTNFHVLWFVENYVDKISDKVSIDASVELNEAFASGGKNFIFPSDVFFYLKAPIRIYGDVNIFSDRPGQVFERGPWGVNHECCVYSNEIITLLDYNFRTQEQGKSLTIEGITFYCRKPYTSLKDKDTPIVRITSDTDKASRVVWGISFDCNINSKTYDVAVGNNVGYVPSYTGLELYANTACMTYVKIKGYIQQVYTGIRLRKTHGIREGAPWPWLTDVTVEGNSWCVYGGDFREAGGPVNIYGSHQPKPAFATVQESADNGYFYGKWINLHGFVWDCGVKQKTIRGELYHVKYPYTTEADKSSAYSGRSIPGYISKDDLERSPVIASYEIQIPSNTVNLLDPYVSQSFIKGMTYKCNGKDLLNNEKISVFNTHHLFGSVDVIDNTWAANVYGDAGYIKNNVGKDQNIEIQVEFDIDNTTANAPVSRYVDLYLRSYGKLEFIVTRGGKVYAQGEFDDLGYNNGRYVRVRHLFDKTNKKSHVVIKNMFTLKKNGVYGLPFIFIPSPIALCTSYAGVSSKRPVFSPYGNHTGFVYFDTDIRKLIVWDGKQWCDSNGNAVK